jgi:hypothetical protein
MNFVSGTAARIVSEGEGDQRTKSAGVARAWRVALLLSALGVAAGAADADAIVFSCDFESAGRGGGIRLRRSVREFCGSRAGPAATNPTWSGTIPRVRAPAGCGALTRRAPSSCRKQWLQSKPPSHFHSSGRRFDFGFFARRRSSRSRRRCNPGVSSCCSAVSVHSSAIAAFRSRCS